MVWVIKTTTKRFILTDKQRNSMNSKVDKYLVDGCMRCKFGGTPECKVNSWQLELETLRQLVLECDLTEELKWGVPCYTFEGKNILLVSAFRDYCALSFFKGSLLKDTHQLLTKPGEHSQSSRVIRFIKQEQILEQREILKTYIDEAIEVEQLGLKVAFKKNPEPTPQELLDKFEEYPALKQAFYTLTPGKQRGYIIYFSQPKQSQSRASRIEKYKQKILNGAGLNDK